MANIYNFNHFNDLNSFNTIELILLSLLFLSIGSLTSLVIYRLSPHSSEKINLFFPRSFCPNCNKSIQLIFLIPLIGYLLQKGICKSCKSKISIFYPVTELIFFLMGIYLIFLYGISEYSLFLFLIFAFFYILFFLDLKFYFLPISINILLILSGFVSNYFFYIFIDEQLYLFNISALSFSLYGFIIGYMFLWVVNFIFKSIYSKDGIGGGDFILFGAIGSIFGPVSLPLILFLGSLLGCMSYIFYKDKFKEGLPLGSFLILGSLFYFIFKNSELLGFSIVI